MNVNGAFREGMVASGVVTRNSKGIYSSCEPFLSVSSSSIKAEAIAFVMATRRLDSIGSANVIIEGDTSNILLWLNSVDIICNWRETTDSLMQSYHSSTS